MPGFGPAHTMALADAHYGQIMGPALAPAMEHRDQLCAYTDRGVRARAPA